jgi:hypothetical protein
MADFSKSGIADLPPTTAEQLQYGSPMTLGWLREALQEGDRLNRADPSYDQFERGLQYVSGQQRLDPYGDKIPYLPRIQINQTRKTVQAHVSALTDVKPLFGYKTTNPAFEFQSHLLNQLTIAWWVNTMADLELGNCIKYTLAGGTGDLKIEWDPYAGLGGSHVLIASDPRDTLPIRPSQQRNLQLWQGLTLREEHTVNVLKSMFPTKAHLFKSSPDTLLDSIMGKFRSAISTLISPASDTLSGLTRPTHSTSARSGQVVLYRTYLNDQTRNQTAKPIAMGDPTANWSYVVQPGEYLYPRKRLIVWTQDFIISDGPNPYWHGHFPLARLKLWELPWHFLGLSIMHDLFPLQDAINETANDLKLGLKQWMEQQTVYDRSAISETLMKQYDSRRPGAKLKLNPTGGEGIRKLDGPPPAVLSLGLEFLKEMTSTFQDLSGTANLQQLLELRQSPGADTIRAYYEALTPELRQEGRMIEAFLRDVGEQTKVTTFQFESSAKRVALLGDAGLALQDFDYDPNTLVPALEPFDPTTGQPTPGYTKELDASLPRDQRAQFFHKQFVFTIAPNSLLAMNAQEQKMLRLQLARMGYYDFWSLMENLEIPNVGQPPPMPLPPLEQPDPNEVLKDLQAQTGLTTDPTTGQQVQGPPAPPQKYTIDPASGQILELRVPQTITERLMAQQQMGIGMTENPAGRKASGQSMPQQETKTDSSGAPRQTVTESAPSKNG